QLLVLGAPLHQLFDGHYTVLIRVHQLKICIKYYSSVGIIIIIIVVIIIIPSLPPCGKNCEKICLKASSSTRPVGHSCLKPR
ncbi:hypothetical protein ALC57_10139, partial [Trachymyrmex cornetzi]